MDRLHETREAWLNDVAHRMAPIFQQLAAPLPARLRIAIGFHIQWPAQQANR